VAGAGAYYGVLQVTREDGLAATRWLTFDCYGTIADWNGCMLGALEPVAGSHAAVFR
jgi:hypothetical protein